MAIHDGIPHEIIAPGTPLFRCEAQPGDLVVIHAMGRFRVARVLRMGPKRAHLIHPAARAGGAPHRPTRPLVALYALGGTEPAGVIQAGSRGRYDHTLATHPAPSREAPHTTAAHTEPERRLAASTALAEAT